MSAGHTQHLKRVPLKSNFTRLEEFKLLHRVNPRQRHKQTNSQIVWLSPPSIFGNDPHVSFYSFLYASLKLSVFMSPMTSVKMG